MTKQYKHKKLGWIAEIKESKNALVKKPNGEHCIYSNNCRMLELIENSDDREEIKDYSVFKKIYDEYYTKYVGSRDNERLMRECIQKHLGITEKEIDNKVLDYFTKTQVKDFLKSKGLLLD